MKTFIYTMKERGSLKKVTIYRIIRNKPVLVAFEYTGSYVDDVQLVVQALREFKQLPRYKHRPGHGDYNSAWLMKEDGVADVIRI